MLTNDDSKSIQQRVESAVQTKTAINIVGGNSKSFYGRASSSSSQVLNLNRHQGIVNYHPSELVMTVRTGTGLNDVEKTLAEQGQMLAFEPPHFAPSATIGGTIACGFSGPRRCFTGSARDFVLGCKIINGKAEMLSFGGEVMKNVAGYDVSRLMVGAMGTLGVLLEISLKVLPKPEQEKTLVFEYSAEQALAEMTRLSGVSLPLSGLCFDGQKMYVRLSGMEKVIQASSIKLGGEELTESTEFWQQYKEHQHQFFQSTEDLWRLSVKPAGAEIDLPGEWFYDWGGALRWLKTNASAQQVFAQAESLQGHATLFKSSHVADDVFQPLPTVLKKLNHNVKQAFDPFGVLNPCRMWRDW